jgi:hypothetical protein
MVRNIRKDANSSSKKRSFGVMIQTGGGGQEANDEPEGDASYREGTHISLQVNKPTVVPFKSNDRS